MLCLFGKTMYSDLTMDMRGNPFYCDCTDYEVFRYVFFFQGINILDSLRCSYPDYLEGNRVRADLYL